MEHANANLERSFERWRSRGDGAALAEVFDRLAPGLLRLAIHLVGDAAAAEDLVQATFVTAIERAPSWDRSRALEPWLQGILANHARDLRRDAQRIDLRSPEHADLASIVERDEHSPLDAALAKEESAALAKALDSLAEPYRAVLILRLRHGLKDADIAHVLARSPGAVRVQLHRGREMLKKLLPAGLVASALALAPGRGLAQVRASVLTHATAVHSTTSAMVLGGVLLTKKVLVALVAVLMILGWIGWHNGMWSSVPTTEAGARSPEMAVEIGAASRDPVLTGSTSSSQRVEALPAPAPVGKLVKLPGRVLDAATNTGIAGARVELFAPRRETLSELAEHSLRRLGTRHFGQPHDLGIWPTVLENLSDLARAGRESFDVYDAPVAGQAPMAQAITNERGEFEFLCADALGFVTCAAAGFETRRIAAMPFDLTMKNDGNGQYFETKTPLSSLTIAMFAPKRLYGYLVDFDGNRVARRMHIAFDGYRRVPSEDPKSSYALRPIDTWPVLTQEDGSFDVLVGADQVEARSVEAGLVLTSLGMHPTRHERWYFESSWQPGQQTEPARLIVKAVPCLVVRDSETKRPIEHFSLIKNGFPYGVIRWLGSCWAPMGRYSLIDALDTRNESTKDALSQGYELTVWAPGFAPSTVTAEDSLAAGEVEVELARGETPAVRGRVHEGSRAIVGSCVTLVPSMGRQYSGQGFHEVIDAVATDEHGEFELRAPPGRYGLCVAYGADVEWRPAAIPSADLVDIDMGVCTSIVAHIHDSNGQPCADHALGSNGPDGNQRSTRSDDQGVATFTRLIEGKYNILVPFVSTHGSFSADQVVPVEVHRGERREVDITIPAPDPRFARLVIDGGGAAASWKVRDRYKMGDWQSVEPDGRIPIDVQRSVKALELMESGAPLSMGRPLREWTVRLPKDPPDGYAIHIAPSGPGYEGIVTSLVDGQPIGGVRIEDVGEHREGTATPSCTTDGNGRFEILGFSTGTSSFGLNNSGVQGVSGDVVGMTFVPSNGPASPPTHVSIAIPRRTKTSFAGVPVATLRGHFRFGTARPRISVYASAELPVAGGTLEVSAWPVPGEDGSYEAILPVAPRYEVKVHDMSSGKEVYRLAWDEPSAGATIDRDFDVP